MDKESLKQTIQTMGIIIGELSDIPLEDFIRQLNFMMKTDKFTDDLPRDIMAQFLMLAYGLLGLKSNVLMGFSAFENFDFSK